jgi:rubrerythrin
MAERCANEAIAKKFEALANDYEEHARRAGKGEVIVDLNGPSVEKTKSASKTPGAAAPSTPET